MTGERQTALWILWLLLVAGVWAVAFARQAPETLLLAALVPSAVYGYVFMDRLLQQDLRRPRPKPRADIPVAVTKSGRLRRAFLSLKSNLLILALFAVAMPLVIAYGYGLSWLVMQVPLQILAYIFPPVVGMALGGGLARLILRLRLFRQGVSPPPGF